MLDDGKTKPGAAGGLAAALVHPVKALENTILMDQRNTDTRIFHGETELDRGERVGAGLQLVPLGTSAVGHLQLPFSRLRLLVAAALRFVQSYLNDIAFKIVILQNIRDGSRMQDDNALCNSNVKLEGDEV